jgi:hypothetical protein
MSVVDGSFDNSQPLEEHASMPLAGGVAGMGFQCGQLWGAALAAGAQAYRKYGSGPQAEAAAGFVSQRLVEAFQSSYGSINCSDVTQIEWKNAKTRQMVGYFLKGGPIRCFSMTADYARTAFKEINTAFPGGHFAPSALEDMASVSCAAMLARKMGASEMQATMAAGFAGGLGLSGGACGALAAAIWLLALKQNKGGMLDFNSPEITGTIDRFVESTEVNFECSEIVGRQFLDMKDHARYMHAGGCSKVLEALSNSPKES